MMEEINFWDPGNFSDWESYRDYWRERLASAGKALPDDSGEFWEEKFKELKRVWETK